MKNTPQATQAAESVGEINQPLAFDFYVDAPGMEPHYRTQWGPDWRYQLAQRLETKAKSEWTRYRHLDPAVRKLLQYRSFIRTEKSHLAASQFPAIDACEKLHSGASTADQLKLLVLADVSREETAKCLGIDAPTIHWWEFLHFDVRSSRGATGWLKTHVIDSEIHAGKKRLASRMKMAIAGGPTIAQILIDSEATLPIKDADRVFQQSIQLQLKLDELLEMPVDSSPAAGQAYMKMLLRYRLDEQKLKLSQEKFLQRCQEARDRTELDRLRLEGVLERASQATRERQEVRAERQRREDIRRQQAQIAQKISQHSIESNRREAEEREANSPLAQFKWRSAWSAARQAAADRSARGADMESDRDTRHSSWNLEDQADAIGPSRLVLAAHQ